MADNTRFYIGGEWVEPRCSETLEVINPATEEAIGRIAMGGREVARSAAPTVKRVAQELGRKSANIPMEDADFPTVVARDNFGMCTNSGQSQLVVQERSGTGFSESGAQETKETGSIKLGRTECRSGPADRAINLGERLRTMFLPLTDG